MDARVLGGDHEGRDDGPTQAEEREGERSPYQPPVLRSHGLLLDHTAQQKSSDVVVLIVGVAG